MRFHRICLSFAAILALLTAALVGSHTVQAQTTAPIPAEQWTIQVLDKRPHDPNAFTEGFELVNGKLYESTGLNGQSSLRLEDEHNGTVLRRVDLAQQYFGEGIAIVGNRLIQLTWQTHVAFVYDVNTFALLGTLDYEDDGWGMCYDGQQIYTSDGSAVISARDPNSLVATRQIPVDLNGAPVVNLNELECVGDAIYANVWYTNTIMRIDKASGHVTAVITVPDLLNDDEQTALQQRTAGTGGVLNGIAYDPLTDSFLITGKDWPWMFDVRFVKLAYF